MRDGINIEQRGVPTAVICTRPFVPTAKAMAKICNLPDYPFAIIDHPLGSLTPVELRQRADVAVSQVVTILERGEQPAE
ncbi:MAG: hypothetical protein AB7R89_26080 [Dehalococcoidia bacterium]